MTTPTHILSALTDEELDKEFARRMSAFQSRCEICGALGDAHDDQGRFLCVDCLVDEAEKETDE